MTNSVLDMNNNDPASETKERESDHEDSSSSIRREGTFDKTSTVDEHDDDKTGNSFLDTINQKFDNMVSEEPDKIDDSLDMSHTKVDTEKKKRMKKSKAFGSSFEKALSRNERSNTITSETQSSVIVEDKNETQEQQIDKVVNIETKKHRKSIKQKDNIEKEDHSQIIKTKSKQKTKPRSSSMQEISDKNDKSSNQVSNRRKSVPAPKLSESVEIESVVIEKEEPTANRERIDSPSSDIDASEVVNITDSKKQQQQQQQLQNENDVSTKAEDSDDDVDGEVSDVSDLTETDIEEEESDDGAATKTAHRADSVQSIDRKGVFVV